MKTELSSVFLIV